jgi:DNA helicase-2/ATP-dependent DNA helicase PcrA
MARPTGKKSVSIELVVGERVSHDTFGLGTVVSLSGEGDRAEATINFGQYGEKRLLLRYAPVEKL